MCSPGLSFQVNGEYDHPGLDLIKHARKPEVFIAGMYIPEAVADLDLRREYKTGEEKIKTNTELRSEIMLLDFDQFLRPLGPGITGHIDIGLDAGQGIYPEIADTVTLKFNLNGERHDHRFHFFGHFRIAIKIGIFQLVKNIAFNEHQLRIETYLEPVRDPSGSR